jgi:hypothetical protein
VRWWMEEGPHRLRNIHGARHAVEDNAGYTRLARWGHRCEGVHHGGSALVCRRMQCEGQRNSQVRTAANKMRLLACPLKACRNRFLSVQSSDPLSCVTSLAVRAPAGRPSQYGKNRFCGGENTDIGSIFLAFHHDSIFCRCFGLQFNQANIITFINATQQ